MKLVFSESARRDLVEIARFIAADNPEAADRWVGRLRRRAKLLRRMPLAGRQVPELDQEGIRELVEGNYRIIYRVVGKVVEVLRVFESHQHLSARQLP